MTDQSMMAKMLMGLAGASQSLSGAMQPVSRFMHDNLVPDYAKSYQMPDIRQDTPPGKVGPGEKSWFDIGSGVMADTIGPPVAKMLPAALIAGAAAKPLLRAGETTGIRAFHGSPHKFDKFSMDRIGTGEGAQAYGHGLYFAENEATARSYRDSLAAAQNNLLPAYRRAQDWLDQWGSPQQARTELDGWIKDFRARGKDDLARQYEQMIPHLDSPNKGSMYEVNIRANPEQFLDWDRPLGQQPLAGARALNPLVERLLQDPHASQHMTPGGPSDQILGHIHDAARAGRNPVSSLQLSPNAVENTLREAGIPGIKYLDQGSRMHPATLPDTPMANEARQFLDAAKGDHNVALQLFRDSNPVNRYATTERDEIQQILKNAANQPTSNYVVFDDSIIDILKRYGLMGGAAAGPLSQLMQTEE
jgi:hypothetical protein